MHAFDRQTDGQTDGRTADDSRPCVCVRSRTVKMVARLRAKISIGWHTRYRIFPIDINQSSYWRTYIKTCMHACVHAWVLDLLLHTGLTGWHGASWTTLMDRVLSSQKWDWPSPSRCFRCRCSFDILCDLCMFTCSDLIWCYVKAFVIGKRNLLTKYVDSEFIVCRVTIRCRSVLTLKSRSKFFSLRDLGSRPLFPDVTTNIYQRRSVLFSWRSR